MMGSVVGHVVGTRGGLIDVRIPALGVGAGARVRLRDGRMLPARVTSIAGPHVILAPFGDVDGVAAGDRVDADDGALCVNLGVALLGRAVDALGAPIDGRGKLGGRPVSASPQAYPPADRAAVKRHFPTGIPAIDGPLAFGAGARIGLFGGPGCGKSTLLETITTNTRPDAIVVGLVGERGREAQRWLTQIDARTTIVCATSDRSAAERVRAAEVALAQADALRRRGLDVLLVLDSLARVAGAARDVAVAAGEPVGRGGYPASVFGLLARLLERAGQFSTGSITLVATVLADGADEHDPVSVACRAALDGHIVLAERLARQGWFPAIDLPASASRTMADVASADHLAAARTLREAVALLELTREARGFGLDPGAGDPAVRRAVAAEGAIAGFLRQRERTDHRRTLTELRLLADSINDGYLR
jgi:type III secretion protein N (ATPase)